MPEERETLTIALNGSVNPSLLDRIRDLYDIQDEVVRKILGDREEFCPYVRDARNSFAHSGRASKEEAILKLWRTTKKLRLMLQALILTDMGVPRDRMIQILAATREGQILST
jgi:hypothetical protein